MSSITYLDRTETNLRSPWITNVEDFLFCLIKQKRYLVFSVPTFCCVCEKLARIVQGQSNNREFKLFRQIPICPLSVPQLQPPLPVTPAPRPHSVGGPAALNPPALPRPYVLDTSHLKKVVKWKDKTTVMMIFGRHLSFCRDTSEIRAPVF